jgi:hypothetical protein
MRTFRSSIAILVLALAACGGADRPSGDGATPDGIANEPLPAPVGAGGAVTGMPDTPGPNEVEIPEQPGAGTEPDPALALDADGNPLPSEVPPDAPTTSALADPAAAQPVPGAPLAAPAAVDPIVAQEAVALVRDYHAAINAAALGRAYALWADGGQASGQSPQEFADGFAQVESMSVEIGTPGRADATTARVPVTLSVRRLDGSQRRLTGHYTLRRPAEAAAAGDPSAWRIASASLREAAP